MRLTHVGLFEGSGIPSLCAKNAGFKTIAQCENDPCCLYCLKRLWPDAIHYSDVRTADWEQIKEPTTLLTAGVPCQPVSCAGKQMGEKDERWLWPDTIRAVRELRPSWVVFENPPTIRLHGLERIVAELEDCGYIFIPKSPLGDFTPLQVGAEHVGAPHKRHRVWIVAHRPRDGQSTQRQTERADRLRTGAGGYEAMADAQRPRLGPGSGESGDEGGAGCGRGELAGGVQLADADQPGRTINPRLGSDPCEERNTIERNRWPAGRGNRQYEWEAPRIVSISGIHRGIRRFLRKGHPSLVDESRKAESRQKRLEAIAATRFNELMGGVGSSVNGLELDLLSATNKALLRMAGNGWVPQIPEMIFRWIVEQENDAT